MNWILKPGLYYYRARYYDLQAGRFVSQDPTGFDSGPNFYAYVINRPVLFNDPFGLYIDPGLQPVVENGLITQIQNIFPGASWDRATNSVLIPEEPLAVEQELQRQGYQAPGPWWNPFLYWDPFAHSGGWEFRTGPQTFSFHFRERYTSSCGFTFLDQIHFDQINPAVYPFQHLFFEVLPELNYHYGLGPIGPVGPW